MQEWVPDKWDGYQIGDGVSQSGGVLDRRMGHQIGALTPAPHPAPALIWPTPVSHQALILSGLISAPSGPYSHLTPLSAPIWPQLLSSSTPWHPHLVPPPGWPHPCPNLAPPPIWWPTLCPHLASAPILPIPLPHLAPSPDCPPSHHHLAPPGLIPGFGWDGGNPMFISNVCFNLTSCGWSHPHVLPSTWKNSQNSCKASPFPSIRFSTSHQ